MGVFTEHAKQLKTQEARLRLPGNHGIDVDRTWSTGANENTMWLDDVAGWVVASGHGFSQANEQKVNYRSSYPGERGSGC